MASWTTRACLFILLAIVQCQAQTGKVFQWEFKDKIEEGTPLQSCWSISITVKPFESSAMSGKPPYYMVALAVGGTPMTSLIRTSGNNLQWVVNQPAGARLLLNVVDSTGSSGKTSGQTSCLPSPNSGFTLSSNVTSELSTCAAWGLRVDGGSSPYTLTLAAPGSLAVTNVTLSAGDNLYTYINRASPGGSLIAGISDAKGRWARGTALVQTGGSADTECAGLSSSSSKATGPNSNPPIPAPSPPVDDPEKKAEEEAKKKAEEEAKKSAAAGGPLFEWEFTNDDATSFSTCESFPITIKPSTAAKPPYYVIAFGVDGIPTTSLAGLSENGVRWVVDQPAGTRVMLSMIDANGRSGGTSPSLYTIIPGKSTGCLPSTTAVEFRVTANATSELSTCQPWGLTVKGGTSPHTLILAALGSPSVTNVTIPAGDDLYTYINRASPGGSLLAAVSDASGKWATGTPLVQTTGSAETVCSDSVSSSGKADASTSNGGQAGDKAPENKPKGSADKNAGVSTQTQSIVTLVCGVLGVLLSMIG